MKLSAAVVALDALAQETRLGIFRALVQAGPAGMAAGELARLLDVPPPTLSFHLRDLVAAGLASATRNGRSIGYRADFAAMDALMAFLSDNCCGGNPAMCAPAASKSAKAAKPRPAKGVRA